jgi:hypothetical protein
VEPRDERRGTLTTLGVKANGVPAKVGGSVPATFTVYDGGFGWEHKSRRT